MTQAQETAQQNFDDAQKAIEAIQGQLNDLMQRMTAEPKNYGIAGDIGRITMALEELAENK